MGCPGFGLAASGDGFGIVGWWIKLKRISQRNRSRCTVRMDFFTLVCGGVIGYCKGEGVVL